MAHTIVLFQPGKLETRTYWDFESLNDALECKLFVIFFLLTTFYFDRYLPFI